MGPTVSNAPKKPLVKQRSVSSSSANQVAPDIAFMSSSDAVEALRKKYGLISNDATERKAHSSATAPDATKRDIFDTARKKSAMEVKQHELQVATLVKQCPGSTHFQAENALKANGFNVPRALKTLKVERLFLLASESDCREALRRANGDPDMAHSILQQIRK